MYDEVDREDLQKASDICDALECSSIEKALIKLDEMYIALDKHYKGLEAVHKICVGGIDRLNAEIAYNREFMREIAGDVARAGTMSGGMHMMALMRIIERLLDMSGGSPDGDDDGDDGASGEWSF